MNRFDEQLDVFADGSDDPADPAAVDRARTDTVARLLAGLNPDQQTAVTSDARVLRIIAGAGSGKTRVLTRRIARRVAIEEVDPRRVLAVTFTRKAASELRHRISQLGLRGGVNAGTFHSIALSQLRQRWEERGITPPGLLDRKVGLVASVLPRAATRESSTIALDVTGEIEWAKARMIPANQYAQHATEAGRRTPLDPETVGEAYARYEKEKLARRMVDFDDILRLATRDLEADPEYAAARRWRFRHLFVDEFQDVNPLQFRLLQAWVGDDPDLCVVGDPNQAIYAWNGADSRYLDRFSEWFPGAETVELTHNYRSSPQILGLANVALTLTPSRRFDLVPNRPDGPVPRIRQFESHTAEAAAIARMVRDNHAPGSRWADQAVLVRTNAQLPVFEEAFAKAGIPFRSRGKGRFLDQPEVKEALTRLQRSVVPLPVALADLESSLTADADGVTATTADEAAETHDATKADDAVERSGGRGRPRLAEDRRANLIELVRLGREFLDIEPSGDAAGFVAFLRSSLRSDDGTGGGDAVELVTFHAAKGLEWPTVYLAGLEKGLVPIHHADTAEALAEETRLFYVALTRAESNLTMSWCDRRTFGSRTQKRERSPFLDTMEEAIGLLRESRRPADLQAQLAEVARQRAALRAANGGPRPPRRSPVGPALDDLSNAQRAAFEALRKWRLDQARLTGAPAFTILNDRTLLALVHDKPTSRRELLAVNGFGAVKVERYGEEVLAILTEHLS